MTQITLCEFRAPWRNRMARRQVLSLCTSAGLWDKVFVAAGYDVVPGCEIMPHKRRMYQEWIGGEHLCHDLKDLPDLLRGEKFFGIIGGIPCQSFSKTRACVPPKFGDLTLLAEAVLDACPHVWFLLENVCPLKIRRSRVSKMNALNYGQPPQSRERWFTHSRKLRRPDELFPGDVDSLMAYPVVAGRVYGPRRGAILQGHPTFADLPFRCKELQESLADGVPAGLAEAWLPQINALRRW